MSTTSHSRLSRLAETMNGAGIDAFLAWHPVTMGYLHNFHEGAHERFMALCIHRDGRAAIICPSLSVTQAQRAGITDVRSWRDGENALELFLNLADEWGLRSAIIAVDEELPAHMLLPIQTALPAALFRTSGDVLSGLMRIKSPEEIKLLRKAGHIADEAFDAILPMIKEGMTERDLEYALRDAMTRLGGTPTFSIVAAGPNGAEPHHLSDDTKLKRGDVVILDFGCNYEGYLSDITRTVAIGEASDEAKSAYELVYAAHMAARKAIKPGVSCGAIDDAARSVIENGGFGEFFMHRTGHGIGLRGHEEPYILSGNPMPLVPGHCFSIEPGVYFPGKFGVRIENIVTLDESGEDSLNANPSPTLLVV